MKHLLSRLKTILKIILDLYFSPKILASKFSYRKPNDPQINLIAKELRQNGIAYVKDYYTKEQVDNICKELVPELDKLDDLRDQSDQNGVKWLNEEKTKMVQKDYGYSRLLDIAKYGNHSKSHAEDKFFREVASAYYARKCQAYQTIVQKSVAPDNPIGLDYHYDGVLPRFKAFMYLHDVGEEHGPFSLVKGTHKMSWFKLRKIVKMFEGNAGIESIIKPEEMDQNIRVKFDEEIAVAKSGTLIFADVNAIHRGILTQKGCQRYAIAVYFSPNK